MNIRKRLILSYILLVILVMFYGSILLTFRNIQRSVDHDMEKLYTSKDVWNDVLISLNELQLNWASGETYKVFKRKYQKLELMLWEMNHNSDTSALSHSDHLQMRKHDLYQTWLIASESINQISNIIETAEFKDISKILEKQPGLQSFSNLWNELYYSSKQENQRKAYIISQVIDKIEFFPIYSETLNHLFSVIIEETDQMATNIEHVQFLITIVFFVLFLLIYMIFAIRFSNSLSQPIIKLSMRLSSFIGRNLKLESSTHDNEITLLENSADSLIDHYTYLAELASRLAKGELNSPILKLQNQGVVGDALKNINRYLTELAETSQWIREGNYGASIQVKSNNDTLAENFNIMSKVINEKISTLRNIFEAVEESIVVTDQNGSIIEANSNFLQLTGLNGRERPNLENYHIQNFLKDQVLKNIRVDHFDMQKVIYTEINDLKKGSTPVKVVSSAIPVSHGNRNHEPQFQQMYFITNESLRMRMEREREKLRSHAVEAELRALRAQINPHFLFNTLNSIVHLIESERNGAVKMIEQLADLFRYSLSSTRRNRVSLTEELTFIRQYLHIEKMRFGDKLFFKFLIDEKDASLSIPPMLLQPIVENAVKHGADEDGNIRIIIQVERKNRTWLISIKDYGNQALNFSLLHSNNGTGIRNVNRRLETIYHQGLRFRHNEPQGLCVTIPIQEA